jgi:signal transduction histidine kinase
MNRVKNYRFKQPEGFQEIEAFYSEFVACLENESYDELVLNLLDVDFLIPEFVLALTTATKIWYEKRQKSVIWQTKGAVRQYLERADVFARLAQMIEIDSSKTEAWSRSSSINLMELRELDSEAEQNSRDVARLIETCIQLFVGRLKPQQIGAVSTLLSELAQNICHSDSYGYSLVQLYRNGQVHLGIVDTGIGIPTSLAPKFPHLGNDSAYLQKSLESGVSSKSGSNGLGLFQVQQLVKTAGGILVVRSNHAMLQIHSDQIYCWDRLTYIPGTQVYISIWGEYQKSEWDYLLPNS